MSPPQSQKAQKAPSISGCPFIFCRPTDPVPYDHSPVEERRQSAGTAEPRLSFDLPTWQNLSTRQRLEYLQLLSRVFERIDNRARDRHHSAAHVEDGLIDQIPISSSDTRDSGPKLLDIAQLEKNLCNDRVSPNRYLSMQALLRRQARGKSSRRRNDNAVVIQGDLHVRPRVPYSMDQSVCNRSIACFGTV